MPLDITFTLSDQDLDHFQGIVDKAKSAMQDDQNAEAIEAAAKQLIIDAKEGDLPAFIGDRLAGIAEIGDGHLGATGQEILCDGPADAARTPGDHRDPARKLLLDLAHVSHQ